MRAVNPKDAARRIVAGARRHFLARGFRNVTMDDLARELGMSKKTLYAHFPSKTALLKAVISEKLASVDADLERITSRPSDDFAGRLHEMLACMREHTDELKAPFVRDVGRHAPQLFALVLTRRRKIIQRHFGKLLGEGRGAAIIRRDIPVELLTEMLVGATESIINPRTLAEFGLTPQTGFAQIISVFLEGVLTEKGRFMI
jgi:AcrR family transcriptional regulator